MARRLGHCAARLTAAIRKVHDFLTVGAAAPLQEAGAAASGFPRAITTISPKAIAAGATTGSGARQSRLPHVLPRGAYYVMTDISPSASATT